MRDCHRIFGSHAAHLRRRLLRYSLPHQRMRSLRCSAPPTIYTTWRPNLSMSPLNGLLSNVRTKEGPGESYLPGPGQRLLTGFGDRVAQGDRGHHTTSIGD
jgi:hypothetical protein